ncbi:uncharacterized protein LOC127861045 [Dreissena polymorpha]|uniref:Claudin n=1 Tax=Dreissena polymorpha TaxID=45954 RepID=A0A9D4BRH8_DREPO|nr:uncharacterized protein LOC127861045 [Dreissena polymorpha]KAH3704791.1 hypothetical protein DPMN_079852 [Dreissena polymorpha]
MKQIIGFAGFGLACLNSLFSILALALKVWMEKGDGYESRTYGLWKSCYETPQVSKCDDIPPVAQVLVFRGFVAVGMVLMFGAAVTAGLRVFLMKDRRILYLATVGLSSAAGFCLLIGFAAYASYSGDLIDIGFTYVGGFGLCVVAWLFSWIQAGIFFVHGRLPESPA